MGRNLVLRIDYDECGECPLTDWDGMWTLYSFNKDSIHYRSPDHFLPPSIGLRRKLEVGTAFWLDYYEHGLAMYSIAGDGPQCPWDTVRCGGILIWEHKPSDMGAKTVEDRRKDAESSIEIYNNWMNGDVFCWCLECRETGEHLDSCGGYYETDYMAECINEHLEPGDNVIVTGEGAGLIHLLRCLLVEDNSPDSR